jgi:hypothetical protein
MILRAAGRSMQERIQTEGGISASDSSDVATAPPVFHLRAVPILVVIAIGFGLPPLAVLIVHTVNRVIALPGHHVTWVWVDWVHGVMTCSGYVQSYRSGYLIEPLSRLFLQPLSSHRRKTQPPRKGPLRWPLQQDW